MSRSCHTSVRERCRGQLRESERRWESGLTGEFGVVWWDFGQNGNLGGCVEADQLSVSWPRKSTADSLRDR